MGGRGASAGLRGGGSGGAAVGSTQAGQQSQPANPIAALNTAYQSQAGQKQNNGGIQAVFAPGYTNNNNPNVVKFQGQDDDKTARYLAKVNNDVDTSAYPDGYAYYPGSFQKWSLAMGLNDKPQVVPDAQFNQIVSQNNLQVLYRGESGQQACDRFMDAKYSHTGIGSYGDGFYFSEDKHVANKYAQHKGGANGRVIKMALSPTARAITYSDLYNKMYYASSSLQKGLKRAGTADKTKYLNEGEAQYALKLGYNVVTMGNGYHYAITRDAFIVSDKTKNKW